MIGPYELAHKVVQEASRHGWHPVQSEIQGNRVVLVFSKPDESVAPAPPGV